MLINRVNCGCIMVLDHHLITLQLRCKAIATPHSDLGQRMQRKLAYYAEPQPAVYHFNDTKVRKIIEICKCFPDYFFKNKKFSK